MDADRYLGSNSIDLRIIRRGMVLDLRIITNRKLHHECTIGAPLDARGNLRDKRMVSAATAYSQLGAGFETCLRSNRRYMTLLERGSRRPRNRISYPLLSYDIDTVLPKEIITDTGGRFLWPDETDDYGIRPGPDVYLTILRKKTRRACVIFVPQQYSSFTRVSIS